MNKNLDIINHFFEAYGKRDISQLKQVISEDAKWFFPGENPLSGCKSGIMEIQ